MSGEDDEEEERLSPEDFDAGLARIREYFQTEGAGAETRELVRWFLARYPSFIDRCRYVTRKHRELANAPRLRRGDVR